MRFLVAVDGSEESDAALDHAVELAGATGASVSVVHAVDPTIYEDRQPTPVRERDEVARRNVLETIDDAELRGERVLAEASDRATAAGVDVETRLLYGDPVEVIPAYATDQGFDVLYLGHRPLPEAYERVLGSVAKSIIERSTIPVTVVQ
jgi:nucleotide-binding universal stress UspA family protein